MKSERISAFLSERIAAGDFPSAVYLVAEKGEIRFSDALGFAVKTDEIEIPARFETIYDLASLTKVLVTGLLAAKLIESDAFNLEDRVSKFYPQFARSDKSAITIRQLISHASGFPAWRPFYLLTRCEENMASCQNEIFDIIADENLETQPGTKVKYSDLNFLTLGFLIERLYGKSFEEITASEIFQFLNLTRTFFVPPNRLRNEIAAAEFGNNYEKQTCLEMGYQIPNSELFRTELIWGAVHDGNAYLLNGIAPHAGLFSTAEEVFKIALQFLPRSTTLLKPETCELFKTNFTQDLNEARSLAFQLAATEDSTASEALAKNSFGHLGFTGTSLWIEPESERIFILLTNRTHRPLPFVNINSTRRRFHELATVDLENF